MKTPIFLMTTKHGTPVVGVKAKDSMKSLLYSIDNLTATSTGLFNKLPQFIDYKGATIYCKELRQCLEQHLSLLQQMLVGDRVDIAVPKQLLKDKPLFWRGSILVRRVQ